MRFLGFWEDLRQIIGSISGKLMRQVTISWRLSKWISLRLSKSILVTDRSSWPKLSLCLVTSFDLIHRIDHLLNFAEVVRKEILGLGLR